MRRTSQAAPSRVCLVATLIAIPCATHPALGQPESPRSDAEAVLAQVQAKKEATAVAAEPIANARRALERAERVRNAGDSERAPLLERAAREWAELARDLMRAVEAELKADEAERRLADIETRTVRARALLEETIARRGRARNELEALEASGAKPSPPTGPELAPAPPKKPAQPPAPEPARPPSKKPAEPRP